MLDDAHPEPRSQSQAAPLQRAKGRAYVALKGQGDRTRLSDLHQSGCAKAMLPRVTGAPEIVFLNTAGGVTGGDRLEYGLDLASGGVATATTQTAERAYASAGGRPGRIDVRLSAESGARLDWLPQETILFEHSDIARDTEIALHGDAELLACETVVLGRAAMGERVCRARLLDRRVVTRNGAPLWRDPVQIEGTAYKTGPAGLNGARAVATLILAAPGAEDAADPLRRVLADHTVEAGVSGWDGRCLVRLRAPDAWPLRRALAAALTHVRRGPLPRVWQL